MATDIEEMVEQSGTRRRRIKEVRRQIDAEGVEYMYYQFVSVTGRIMGKGIPPRNGSDGQQGVPARLRLDRQPVHRPHGNYIGYGPEARELVGIPDVRDLLRPPVGS